MSGSILVTIGAAKACPLSSCAIYASATRACSALVGKIAERYCVPWSGPWKLSSVGSWLASAGGR